MTTLEAPTRPSAVCDPAYVKSRMEQWARWCHGSTGAGGMSITGRLMHGIKGNVCSAWLDDMQARRGHDPDCPICHGTGRARLDDILRTRILRCPICDQHGKFLGDHCFRCHGTRFISLRHVRVNPACIPGTRHVGHQANTDACTLIDALVSAWRDTDPTYWMNRVVVSEHHHNGTQEMKARRLRISLATYKRHLTHAHRRVERLLTENDL